MRNGQKQSKSNGNSKSRNGLIAALDVGTTKICCLIARNVDAQAKAEGRGPKIVGFGHHISAGMRSGTVIDLHDAEAAIRRTVETAEQMAGENIGKVLVNLSGGKPTSQLVSYDISVSGHEIGEADLRRVHDPSHLLADQPEENELIHTIPIGYCIDGSRGVRDPRGMYGDHLSVNMHMITAMSGPIRNLESSVSLAHLGVESLVVTPYASALACLVDDEKKMGVTCIDIGGGTTSIAVYLDGQVVHTDIIPLGGIHVTNDIARGLATPLEHAERMKILYGSAIPSSNDDREIIKVPVVGEDAGIEVNQLPRSMLVSIIRPRIEEILEIAQRRLEAAGFDKVAGRQVVLTGGTSQLPGICDLAASFLNKQVRQGRPAMMEGLAEAVSGPAFSTSVGLLQYAMNESYQTASAAYRPSTMPKGAMAKAKQWFRENF